MCEQCVPGSLSSSPAQEPGNEAMYDICGYLFTYHKLDQRERISYNYYRIHSSILPNKKLTGLENGNRNSNQTSRHSLPGRGGGGVGGYG